MLFEVDQSVLTDAAREMGQLEPEDSSLPRIGSINLTPVNQVLQLSEQAQETYIKTGKLPPKSYLTDLNPDGPALEDPSSR